VWGKKRGSGGGACAKLVKSLETDRACPGLDNFAQAGGWGFYIPTKNDGKFRVLGQALNKKSSG